VTVRELLSELVDGPYPPGAEVRLSIRSRGVFVEASLNCIGSDLRLGSPLELSHEPEDDGEVLP
jgi:hypothetical protein